jgi:hypothetical protein
MTDLANDTIKQPSAINSNDIVEEYKNLKTIMDASNLSECKLNVQAKPQVRTSSPETQPTSRNIPNNTQKSTEFSFLPLNETLDNFSHRKEEKRENSSLNDLVGAIASPTFLATKSTENQREMPTDALEEKFQKRTTDSIEATDLRAVTLENPSGTRESRTATNNVLYHKCDNENGQKLSDIDKSEHPPTASSFLTSLTSASTVSIALSGSHSTDSLHQTSLSSASSSSSSSQQQSETAKMKSALDIDDIEFSSFLSCTKNTEHDSGTKPICEASENSTKNSLLSSAPNQTIAPSDLHNSGTKTLTEEADEKIKGAENKSVLQQPLTQSRDPLLKSGSSLTVSSLSHQTETTRILNDRNWFEDIQLTSAENQPPISKSPTATTTVTITYDNITHPSVAPIELTSSASSFSFDQIDFNDTEDSVSSLRSNNNNNNNNNNKNNNKSGEFEFGDFVATQNNSFVLNRSEETKDDDFAEFEGAKKQSTDSSCLPQLSNSQSYGLLDLAAEDLKSKVRELLIEAKFEPLPNDSQSELRDINLTELIEERQRSSAKESNVSDESTLLEESIKWEGSHFESRYKNALSRLLPQIVAHRQNREVEESPRNLLTMLRDTLQREPKFQKLFSKWKV